MRVFVQIFNRDSKGSSLLEILVALSIVAIVSVSHAYTQLQNYLNSENARRASAVAVWLQEYMETNLDQDWDDVYSIAGTLSGNVYGDLTMTVTGVITKNTTPGFNVYATGQTDFFSTRGGYQVLSSNFSLHGYR